VLSCTALSLHMRRYLKGLDEHFGQKLGTTACDTVLHLQDSSQAVVFDPH
jgi:hypothetical protein